MGDELKELKTVLRSLVVSSPTQVDLRSLLRDYRNMMGSPLPATKFGYTDPQVFIRERFSDCFRFDGLPSNPYLTLIVPDSLKHIDKFVQKQRVSPTVKFLGKRRSILESTVKPVQCFSPAPSLIVETFHQKKFEQTTKYAGRPIVKATDSAGQDKCSANQYNSIKNENINSTSNYKASDHNKDSRIHDKGTINHVNGMNHNNNTMNHNKDIMNHNRDSMNHNKVQNHKKNTVNRTKNCNEGTMNNKREPLNHSKSNLNNSNRDTKDVGKGSSNEKDHVSVNGASQLETDGSSSKGGDSGRHTLSTRSSGKQAQLETLKAELLALLAAAPGGLWCTDLLRCYRERYGCEMNFSRCGFPSILHAVYSLGDAAAVSRPVDTGDWLVRAAAPAPATPAPATPAAPGRAPASLRARSMLPFYAPPAHAQPAADDDALPGIQFDEDVFPADCMRELDSIPRQALGALAPGAMLEVLVGEVYSPSHLWLIRLGARHNIAMEDLMDDMTRYFTAGEGRGRVLARGAVRAGQYCSSVFERDWHRSLIVKVLDSETVKVRHVDYGTVDTVSVRALKPLPRRWARLPAQALRARLAGCRPAAAGRRWPRAAAAHLLTLVRDRRLVANVVAVDHQAEVLEVLLLDTAGAADACLSAALVRAGHAAPRPDSALGATECYLFPRFEALEDADTPNYAEIHAYLRDGIALEYVDAYRRHVPAALPEPGPAAPPTAPPAPPADVATRVPLLWPEAAPRGVHPARTPLASLTPPPSEPASPTDEPTSPPPDSMSPPARSTISPVYAISPSIDLSPLCDNISPSPESGNSKPSPVEAEPPPYCEAVDGDAGAGAGPQSPPPAYSESVSLSVAECRAYQRLLAADPAAASRYITTALRRAMAALPALSPPPDPQYPAPAPHSSNSPDPAHSTHPPHPRHPAASSVSPDLPPSCYPPPRMHLAPSPPLQQLVHYARPSVPEPCPRPALPSQYQQFVHSPRSVPSVRPGLSLNPAASSVRPGLSTNPAASSVRPGLSLNPAAPSVRPGLSLNPAAPSVRPGLSLNPAAPSVRPGLSLNPTAPEFRRRRAQF